MSDANHQSKPACSNCAREMLLIGRLPGIELRRRVMVYRCEGCNNVVAQDDASANPFSASAPCDSTRKGP